MEIVIKTSSIQFKNPQIGQPTRAVEEHYHGRRITALVNGVEQLFRFTPNELVFDATEEDMITAIKGKMAEE